MFEIDRGSAQIDFMNMEYFLFGSDLKLYLYIPSFVEG
jgi:hypothetical protein